MATERLAAPKNKTLQKLKLACVIAVLALAAKWYVAGFSWWV